MINIRIRYKYFSMREGPAHIGLLRNIRLMIFLKGKMWLSYIAVFGIGKTTVNIDKSLI